ncbi:MAG: type II secretion system F family protein [Candidatus Levybacteria bacterium]|nr:type II secretion system F family protein [Candidatus Levybacteria bacterium]
MSEERISLSGNEKYTFISNLATMLSAGIPILETVDSLLEDAKGHQKKLLQIIREDLMQGKRLYMSFAKFPSVFDKVTVNIIRASEEAGTLNVALYDITVGIRKDMEFSDKIKSALFYPIFVMVVFFGVLLMILVIVIPRISLVFSQLNVVLPLPTIILIFVSNALLQHTVPISVLFLLIAVSSVYLYRKNRRAFLLAFFSLPFLSSLARQIDLTRFSHSMYLLVNAGIPITSALDLTRDVVIKKEVSETINHSIQVASSGRKLSQAFKERRSVIPGIMIKITEAGERTGSLEKSMEDISIFLEYQVGKTLQTLTVLLEPVMIIAVGVLVGGMILAIIAPIYNLISQIGGR